MAKTTGEKFKIVSGMDYQKYKKTSLVGILDKMKVENKALVVGKYSTKLAHYVSSAISKYKKKYPKKIFSQRKLENGKLGVWRLK